MLIKRIYDNDLAQASYLIGCQVQGTAIVIDPRRDIQVYLDEAEQNDLKITTVTETHIHADYLSGSRDLAAATGATLHLSAEGGPDWLYRFEHEPLRHNDEIKLGNITLRALHTPGHTPEHLSFLVTDHAATDKPGFLFTGDFIFVGDLGRPDLLDEAAGGQDTRFPMARQLFSSLRETMLTLPDYIQIHPGHGAGSACGKALGAVESSTVGYEKASAWWAPYLLENDEEGFVAALLADQPDAPSYFGRMKRNNRQGPELLGVREALPLLDGSSLRAALADGAVLLDTRPRDEYAQAATAGSLHVPAGTNFVTWAAWVVDPENAPRDLVLLTADSEQAETLRAELSRVGIDSAVGYATSVNGLETTAISSVKASELSSINEAYILDIRSESEHVEGRIPGATNLHGSRVLWNLDQLPQDRPIITHCQNGGRNAVVASALRASGFSNVIELEGSFEAWLQTQPEHAGV